MFAHVGTSVAARLVRSVTVREAGAAFAPGLATRQLAMTPRRVVLGDLAEFIIRWGDCFAAAYERSLAHPSLLPEEEGVPNRRGRG